jgi:3-oxoacyl-[acyl-carrier protein] reductase
MAMTQLLAGVRAVVTGASRGIGRATSIAMAELGAEVVMLARTHSPLEDGLPDDVAARLYAVGVDVTDPEAVGAACAFARERFGGIDVLVNNAGVPGPEASLWTLDPDALRATFEVNTLGPFHLMQAILPGMVAAGSGVVVNISSGQAVRPQATKSAYGASKAALDHLTAAAALELAGSGVRIHTVYPGPVDTALNSSNRDGGNDRDRSRLRPPQEPAALIAWLASSEGARVGELVVRWRDPEVRERLRQLPGFPGVRAQ